MEKDFDKWNEQKKHIDAHEENKLYHEREIWWCSLGTNIGFGQDGTGEDRQRPVLILRGMSRHTCYIVPLTTSARRHKLRIDVGLVEGKRASALLSQMRLIDTKRLVNKIEYLSRDIFDRERKAAKEVL